MENITAQRVYDSLSGVLLKEYCVPGVEDVFMEGKPCAELYRGILKAYERLCSRLGTVDEDVDVEVIINGFMEINRIIGIKMYEYGYEKGRMNPKTEKKYCKITEDVL